jgi:hypothetical protein
METREQLTAEIDRVIKSYDARRRPQFEKILSGNDGGEGKLELARSIQPMQFKKGSILAQFTDTNSDFRVVTPIDLAASGPGTPGGDRWAEVMRSQYPTIAAMQEVQRPTSEPAPWDAPRDWTNLEARYQQPAGRLDPGPSQSIPAALGFPELKALRSALAKMKSPALAAVDQACKSFNSLMTSVHDGHHNLVASLDKAHSEAMDKVHSVAAARALTKNHVEHVSGVCKAHLDTVGRLHQRFGKAVTDALTKIAEGQGQYHGESIVEPPTAPDFVN